MGDMVVFNDIGNCNIGRRKRNHKSRKVRGEDCVTDYFDDDNFDYFINRKEQFIQLCLQKCKDTDISFGFSSALALA